MAGFKSPAIFRPALSGGEKDFTFLAEETTWTEFHRGILALLSTEECQQHDFQKSSLLLANGFFALPAKESEPDYYQINLSTDWLC